MRPLSLATRLTLMFAVAAAIVFPVFGWIIIGEIEHHFEEGDTAELRLIADAVYDALAGVRGPADRAPVERRFDDILIGHHSASLYIVRGDGRLVYQSGHHPDLSTLDLDTGLGPGPGAGLGPGPDPGPDPDPGPRPRPRPGPGPGPGPDPAAPRDRESIALLSDAGETYRVLVRRIGGAGSALPDPHTLVVATPIDYHLVFLAGFRTTLWLMVASGILIMSAMGWVAVRQGHAPLREIVSRMRLVSATDGAETIPPQSVPRELGDLATSFNEMTRRVDDSFRRLTHFNADIAHELRTPITNLMTQTQVSLSRARTVDEYREILYSNMEEYERMAQMVGDMLFLAQQDSGAGRRETGPVDLAAELGALFEYYEGWAEERGITLALEGRASVTGDRLLLQRAFGNLLSNAIRHTPAGETVRVGLRRDGDSVSVEVVNPGAPIPADDVPKVFDRFFRVDPSRQRRGEGAGLGLAIVKSIVEVHGGTVTVASDQRGTRFTVRLPAGR